MRQQLAFVGDPAFQLGVALLAVLVLFAQARQFGVLLAEAVLLCVQFGGARRAAASCVSCRQAWGLVLCAVVARARAGSACSRASWAAWQVRAGAGARGRSKNRASAGRREAE